MATLEDIRERILRHSPHDAERDQLRAALEGFRKHLQREETLAAHAAAWRNGWLLLVAESLGLTATTGYTPNGAPVLVSGPVSLACEG